MTPDDLRDFFVQELGESGLFENEIDDWIEFWLGPDMKIFLGRHSGTFSITYIPTDQIDEILSIETSHQYDEVLRVFFSIAIVDDDSIPALVEPVYDPVSQGSDVLHEWGVFEQEAFLHTDV